MTTTGKEVRVSVDGIAYYILPGGSGTFNDTGEQVTDTIFGQTFQSTQPGLISWTSNANALYKGFAGYVAKLLSPGTSTVMTAEAMALVSGKTYKISDTTKQVMDYTKTTTIKDGGVAVLAANIETINYLFGSVTFVSTYTPTGAITVDGYYFPMTEISKGNSFTLTQTVATIDETDFPTARANNGYRVFVPGLRTVSLQIGGFYDSASAFWEILEAREDIVIEVNPDGSGLSRARGIFKLVTRDQSGDVGAQEVENRTFNLSVPENVDTIFNWEHDASTTLSQSIIILLNSFIDQTLPYVQYAPDGDNDIIFTGQGVLTDVSLSSSLSAMNEFQANFQGSGAPTRIQPS